MSFSQLEAGPMSLSVATDLHFRCICWAIQHFTYLISLLPLFLDVLLGKTALVRLANSEETQTIAPTIFSDLCWLLGCFDSSWPQLWAAAGWSVNFFWLDWKGLGRDCKYFGNSDERLQLYGLHYFTAKVFHSFNPLCCIIKLTLLLL